MHADPSRPLPGAALALASVIMNLLAVCMGAAGPGLLLFVTLPADIIGPILMASGVLIPVMFGLAGAMLGMLGMWRAPKFRWPFWVSVAGVLLTGAPLLLAGASLIPMIMMEY